MFLKCKLSLENHFYVALLLILFLFCANHNNYEKNCENFCIPKLKLSLVYRFTDFLLKFKTFETKVVHVA